MLAWDLIEFAYENRLSTNEWAVWGVHGQFQYSIEKTSSGYRLTVYAQVEKSHHKDFCDLLGKCPQATNVKVSKKRVSVNLNRTHADMNAFREVFSLICSKLEALSCMALPVKDEEIEPISEEKYSYLKELKKY